jgi:hypothetical protein
MVALEEYRNTHRHINTVLRKLEKIAWQFHAFIVNYLFRLLLILWTVKRK